MIKDASRSRSLALILWVVLAHAPAEAQEGFSSYAGLVRLPLSTDGSDVVPVEVGDPDLVGRFAAMALGPDGELYTVTWNWPDRLNRLYMVDPQTAEAILVGELVGIPAHQPLDMTFDDEGRLWLLSWTQSSPFSSTLYQVDHQTAAATEFATGMADLYTLAFHGGTFYGIVAGAQESEFWLASINRETGDLTPIVELDGFAEGPWCRVDPDKMEFDDHGRLWVAALWVQGCIIIPFFHTGIHFYANPLDGIQTSRSRVRSDNGRSLSLSAFAVRGPAQTVVEVPALSFGGTLILATVLAALGLALARRRS